jgi:hypothetical protein
MSQNSDTTSRRNFIATAAIAASSFSSIKSALAQPTPQAPGEADFLFVHWYR